MLELAVNHGKQPVLLNDVAKRQEISEKYLSQIMIPLMKSGLVVSSQGNPRGYLLSKEPENITIFDIVDILEGGIAPLDCLTKPGECEKTETCVVRKVWAKLDTAIGESLSSVSLQGIAVDIDKCGRQGSMYHI